MKFLALSLFVLNSTSAMAAQSILCMNAAEVFAVKQGGRGTQLIQHAIDNRNGTFMVQVSIQTELDEEYLVTTKLSANGKSCKVTAFKLVDSQSG